MMARGWSWGVIAIAFLGACSDEEPGRTPVPEREKPGNPQKEPEQEPEPDPEPGTNAMLLRKATDCEDLSAALRDEIRARLARGSSSPSVGEAGAGGAWGGDPGGGFAGEAFGGGAGASSDDPNSGPVFTGTNTHVPGVDEPDFVKTDGQYFYMVDRSTLRVARGYPADELTLVDSAPLQGVGREILLADGEREDERLLVVYSFVAGAEVLRAAEVKGRAETFTKLSVFRFAAETLSLVAEYFFEGHFVSARRQAYDVRTLLTLARPLPELDVHPSAADRKKAELLVLERIQEAGDSVADYSSEEILELIEEAVGEILAEDNEAVISEIDAEGFIPRGYQVKDGTLVEVSPDCDAFYVPEVGSLDLAITFVPQIDLTELEEPPAGAALLGASELLFENSSVTIIASPPDHSGRTEVETQVHLFEVGDQPLEYRASGVVPGFVHNQFAIDERSGTVRIVTSTSDRVNHLYTLETEGNELTIVGDAGEYGIDEDVRSVRFVGDTAYVVTFRETDPLFVFDLSDPSEPRLLGELEIPGFSQYMHPIGESHLLTIGRGEDWNTVLRLFDVSDPTKPKATFLHDFDYGLSSAASVDHRAFTYFAERGLLAVPFSGWDWRTGRTLTQIALIGVSTDEGFNALGALDGAPLTSAISEHSPTCSDWMLEDSTRLQRATFIAETLYGVAKGGIVAAPIQELGTTHEPLAFAQECRNRGAGGFGGFAGFGGEGGEGGVAGAAGFGGEGGLAGYGGEGGFGGQGGLAGEDSGGASGFGGEPDGNAHGGAGGASG